MVDVQRMLTVAGVINIDPSKHNQRQWACGTARCFGGWAVDMFSGVEVVQGGYGDFYVRSDAGVPERFLDRGYAHAHNVMRENSKGDVVLMLAYDAPSALPGDLVFTPGEGEYFAIRTHEYARHLLGLEGQDAFRLFNAYNTLEEVNKMVLAIINGEEYECGRDCDCDLHSYSLNDDDYEDECGPGCSCYEDDEEYDADAAYEDRTA